MSDNIKVVVKVRPLISREIEDKLYYQWRVKNNTLYQIDQNGKDCSQNFTFDKVYDKDAKTSEVYNDIAKPIVEAATAGFNGTIFAYGQTSSGKTYTMTGTDESPGIIPLAVLNLFDIIKRIPDRDFLVRVSYVEIYNESLTDLLDSEKKVKIQETFHGVKVVTTEKVTTSPEEVLDVMKQGKANRQTASTNMNDESSRSHSIFQITIESRDHIEGEEEVGSVNVSQLNLVDLAGSERAGQTGATGLRFKEGTHINKSLSALALVIKQLSEGQNKHVNYRDSKLTRILQNSLGGNAKTSIICAVTPAAVEETISTLQFANRAKAIKNTPAVNAVATSASMIQNLTKQLSALKTALENKKNVEQDNCNLQKQIAHLQRLILNGFHQRSSTDLISGARRKLCQPRRMTISTLHPIQEDPLPTSIPKFCTPSLKYNPLSIPSSSDFVPISGAGSLSCLPEEAPRLITPPPTNKRVNFNEEIIELDSDDDGSPPDLQTCSPYHKCYESSKTPPCILRKNYKEAEKNYRDIIKLTEREKIYSPDVVELMTKLEEKSLDLLKLEENLSSLNNVCKEKDQEICNLQDKIISAEDELKKLTTVKMDLDALCKQYSTKLTDWEVSYETLMKKFKNREKELLSLLEEQSISKYPNKNGTMRELSDTSEVLSDTTSKNNVDPDNDLTTNTIAELRAQITIKEQTISELHANESGHTHKIETLENLNKELKEILTTYKQNVVEVENENSIFTSKINDLNSLVESQKSEIISLNADIDSYNSVIQELQVKLIEKDSTKNINISIEDSDINTMIANEELFIANNENMKNIIQSLKILLENKNEELRKLKSSLETNILHSDNETEITILNEEIKKLKNQLDENVKIIHDLTEEKIHFVSIEKELSAKLADIELYKNNIEKLHSASILEIETLKEQNNKLTAEILALKEEYNSHAKINQTEIENMTVNIATMEENIKSKDNLIATLTAQNNITQIDLNSAKTTLSKLQDIMALLSGNIQEIPDIIDNYAVVFKIFGEKLSALESFVNYNIEDKKSLQSLINKHETEIIKLRETLDDVDVLIDNVAKDFIEYNNTHHNSIEDRDMINLNLQAKIKILVDTIKNMQNNLLHRLECKDNEIDKIKSDLTSKELALNDKSIELEHKTQEVLNNAEKSNNLFHIIFIKISELLSNYNIENNMSSEMSCNSDCCEYILQMVDKLKNYIDIITSQNETKCSDSQVILSEAKEEIHVLTEKNLKLSNDLLKFEVENSALFKEIETIKSNKENLISDLMNSNRILDELQDDLKSKTSEIEILENRVLEWKEQFINIDVSMKQQLHKLEVDNANLKKELENTSSKQSLTVDTSDNYYQRDNLKLDSEENLELKSPPSLLTICCNRIIDAIQPNENDENVSPTSSNTVFCNSDSQSTCRCSQLLSDVNVLKKDNGNLKMIIEKLQYDNKNLVKEQEDAREEIHLLMDSMYELQKKIVNHRTNLSTLTATTYAENKSLSSQLKFLQHYRSLFYKACEKDIPEFKKQLQELMTILKTEYSYKPNDSLRRYSLPHALENSPMQTSLKFESLLDGDLLMLDTNVTLTTCDNTLTGHDQTCFDVTQTSSEVGCQTNNPSEITEIHSVLEKNTNLNLLHSVESLKKENYILQNIIQEYELSKNCNLHLVDSQNSPIKVPNDTNENEIHCEKCIQLQEVVKARDNIIKENNLLTRQLSELTSLKNDLETKYNSLVNEMPSTDALVVKLKNLEKDHSMKSNEISKLMTLLSKKNEELRALQEENDSLSNQVMENIDESDNLKKELDTLKNYNLEITQKCSQLQSTVDLLKDEEKNNLQNCLEICSECSRKEEIISSLQSKLVSESHKRLSRSYSDSDTSSRYNKICTLQNELHAGREDCNELKIEVTNIKNHLDRSNVSISQAMDLDVSMGDSESHTTSLTKECDTEENLLNKSNMPDIPEERPSDLYTLDKIECVNYCIEKTSTNKESFTCDMKIIDVMKMLYTNLITIHNNEAENLVNKLKVYEESKHSLQTQLSNVMNSQEKISKEIEEKDMYLRTMASVVSQIKNNLVFINNITKESEVSDIVLYFKENFFNIVDKEFGLTSLEVFQYIVTLIDEKNSLEIRKLSEENSNLQNQIKNISDELKSLSDQSKALKSELLDKENAYTVEKERMYEISRAVTLEIAATQEILRETVDKVYQELLKQKLVNKDFLDMSLPISKNIPILFNVILQKDSLSNIVDEKNNLTLELSNMKVLLEEKNNQLHAFKEECSKLIDLNKNNAEALNDVNKQLQNQITMHDTLKTVYDKKVEENETNLIIIGKLTEEVNILKDTIGQKETAIQELDTQLQNLKCQSNTENTLQMTDTLQKYKELEQLKSANDIIVKENEALCIKLQEANDVIQQNKLDLEKITSDMLILKETVDQSSNDMDNLRLESKTLQEQNSLLKEQIKEKSKELSRLETNIKTHQKTAEIQCKIITRLKKEKADIDQCNSENVNKAAELMQTLEELNVKSKEYLDTINSLNDVKQSLEDRISKLESEIQNKPRQSLEYNGHSRSRRQSLYESLTTFSENYEDPKKVENVFKSRKCDDLFMDVDGDSNRSTPVRLSKGRDSLASRHDQSEEESSRASSVQATRRRRQSIHDAHRSVSALETSRRHSVDRNNESSGSDTSSELSKLRKQLSACQEELEEWREKFREVDEECETCAEYLRERDEQCRQLRLEKQALETMIDELKQKLQGNNLPKNGTVEAAVNTDEDWANLHSVVVDRMSYDAEVDKNKKLTRIIEELRYQKQELKNTMAKMQKALEKNSYKDRELEAMKSELANAQRSLAEVKERNRELDEECETCAEYLKEREEQCRKLQEAKKALEIKLLDYQDSSLCMSVRKKRQTLHDRNRRPETDYVDVATETSEDLLSQTGESSRKADETHAAELQRLKFIVERVSQQKASLEQQLLAVTAATPLYVSTGSAIVQNQQFTDVMKENQKLKSINAKLIKIYKKNKSQSTNRENEDPTNEI